MEHMTCKNCNTNINDKMDSYYLGEICEFFCSKDCITEYCVKEMGIQKVDIENVRQACDIALFKNGQLYKSNIEDDSCQNCESGTYRFFKMIIENEIDYEIYKCNECGNLLKIKCD
jgi:flavoprotein